MLPVPFSYKRLRRGLHPLFRFLVHAAHHLAHLAVRLATCCAAQCADLPCCALPCRPATPLCELPAAPGPCEAYMPSWYFDKNTNRCTQFIYGGCQGNDNRFATQKACQEACPATSGS